MYFFNPSPPNRHFLDTIKELELLTCVVEIKQLEMEEGCQEKINLFPEDVIAHKVASTIQRLELYFVKENRRGKKMKIFKNSCGVCHLIFMKHQCKSVAFLREFSWRAVLMYRNLWQKWKDLIGRGELCGSMSHYLLTYLLHGAESFLRS